MMPNTLARTTNSLTVVLLTPVAFAYLTNAEFLPSTAADMTTIRPFCKGLSLCPRGLFRHDTLSVSHAEQFRECFGREFIDPRDCAEVARCSDRSLHQQCFQELRIPGLCQRVEGTLSAPRV